MWLERLMCEAYYIRSERFSKKQINRPRELHHRINYLPTSQHLSPNISTQCSQSKVYQNICNRKCILFEGLNA